MSQNTTVTVYHKTYHGYLDGLKTIRIDGKAFSDLIAVIAGATGSRHGVVFDYLPPSVIDGTCEWEEGRNMHREVITHGETFKLGFDKKEMEGLFGAPPITVIVGEEAHPTLFKSLGLLGMGRNRVVKVPVDAQGRMRSDSIPPITGPTILCTQAGNMNTGAFDPIGPICDIAQEAGAWVHVNGVPNHLWTLTVGPNLFYSYVSTFNSSTHLFPCLTRLLRKSASDTSGDLLNRLSSVFHPWKL